MLVILSTHPVQYQVPLWQALNRDGRVPFEVWYLTDHGTRVSQDREFGKAFKWDLETLQGYPHAFLSAARGAAPSSFWRCRIVEDVGARLRSVGCSALWIQGWQVAGYWQAAWAARSAGAQLWLRGESNYLKKVGFLKRPIKRVVLDQLFSRVDHFLYIGTANRKLYESYGVPKERLHHAPYAVDNDRFARQAAAAYGSRNAIRRSLGIPDNAFAVLFCGKLIAKKRPMDLVAAASKAIREGSLPNVHLLFAGSGPLCHALRRACKVEFDAEERVPSDTREDGEELPPASFAGFLNQTEISSAYVAADCLALPSDEEETWGLVVNEALASGLPAVASKACGCVEDLIIPYDERRTFDCGDTGGLARALVHVANQPDPLKGVALPLLKHSIEATVDQVACLYGAIP